MKIFNYSTIGQLISSNCNSITTTGMIKSMYDTLSPNYATDIDDKSESINEDLLQTDISNSIFISRSHECHLFCDYDLSSNEQELVVHCIQSFSFFLKDEFIKKGRDCFVAIDDVFNAISFFCNDPRAQFVANLMHNRAKAN